MNKKIYGIRLCRQCKGICHENSLRETIGRRKKYYCSKQCCKNYLESIGIDAEWIGMMEKIDVITR